MSRTQKNTRRAILCLPTAFFGLIFTTLNILPWITAIPLAAAEFFAMHHICTRVLLNHKSYTEGVTSSPYFAGIISASVFWVGEEWLVTLLPGDESVQHDRNTVLTVWFDSKATQGHAKAHLFYAVMWMLCAYNLFRAITLDPGTCPKSSNEEELKMVTVNTQRGTRR